MSTVLAIRSNTKETLQRHATPRNYKDTQAEYITTA